MDLTPLHKVPNFKKECAEILNEEWKRSLTARLHSLEKSRDSFPVCLVLLERVDNGVQCVVGHSMLSIVHGQALPSCLVESVVVPKSLRGKGYGRIVMKKTEEYAASKGYKVMYLTTHDKQKFYEHLGYQYCSPVVTFNTDIIPEHLANKLIGSLTIPARDTHTTQEGVRLSDVGHNCKSSDSDSGVNPSSKDCDTTISDKCVLSSNTTTVTDIANCTPVQESPPTDGSVPAPPPPSAPPPPPPPPVVAPVTSKPAADGDKITRWDPALVSWMKKTIV